MALHTMNPTTIRELAIEHLALENAELRERLADLEIYRDLAVVALENVAGLTKRNQELARRIAEVNQQLHALAQVAA
jgi:hypothetical protein